MSCSMLSVCMAFTKCRFCAHWYAFVLSPFFSPMICICSFLVLWQDTQWTVVRDVIGSRNHLGLLQQLKLQIHLFCAHILSCCRIVLPQYSQFRSITGSIIEGHQIRTSAELCGSDSCECSGHHLSIHEICTYIVNLALINAYQFRTAKSWPRLEAKRQRKNIYIYLLLPPSIVKTCKLIEMLEQDN